MTATTAREFARRLESVCVVPNDDRPLRTASSELVGSVLVVHPGIGTPEITDADVVALDLRDLPDTDDLEEALSRAVAPLLATVLPSVNRTVLARTGLTDEVFAESTIYSVALDTTPLPAIAPSDTPFNGTLAVLVGERLAPATAKLAARLRVANRAWIVGHDVPLEVAESARVPMRDESLLYRMSQLTDNAGTLSDTIAADLSEPESLADLSTIAGTPPELSARVVERPNVDVRVDFGATQPVHTGEADVRAALLSAHGAAKIFWPYFETLGDRSDERLLETLELAEGVTSRAEARNILRRFGAVYEDGHNWIEDTDPTSQPTSVLPIVVDRGDGTPVVARSYVSWLHPGDAILAIDGVDSSAWFEMETSRSYGATPGARFVNATQELTMSSPPSTLRVQPFGGDAHDVAAELVDVAAFPFGADLYAGSTRASGWLSDVGAHDVYYINLDGTYVGTDANILSHLTAATSARALVLDMRGHPASGGALWDPYAFLTRIVRMSFNSPRYRVPVVVGGEHVDDMHPYESTYEPIDSDPVFGGPVVFITDSMAVSFAEDFGMMIVGAGRVRVVGRPSAGTTGSVTGIQLPGGFHFMMTGMEARWPDGSVLFGQGIEPDVLVTPHAEDFAMGRDPFIVAALNDLGAM